MDVYKYFFLVYGSGHDQPLRVPFHGKTGPSGSVGASPLSVNSLFTVLMRTNRKEEVRVIGQDNRDGGLIQRLV